jgi:hypothetical protein
MVIINNTSFRFRLPTDPVTSGQNNPVWNSGSIQSINVETDAPSNNEVLTYNSTDNILEYTDGLTGPDGPTGPAGPVGPVGPTGPGAFITQTNVVTIGDGTNPFTSTSELVYSQIGNFVMGVVNIVWTSIGSASGVIVIGLPFTCTVDTPAYVGTATNITYTNLLVGHSFSSSDINILDLGNGTSSSPTSLTHTAFGATGNIRIGFNTII